MLGEWIIDIIKEWVGDQGFLTAGFVDRGDPAAYDFLAGDLTLDGSWHVLDLSGIIPAGAKAVGISLQIQNTAVSRFCYFRKFGNASTINVSVSISQGANIFFGSDISCPVDTSGRIEYAFFGGGWSFVSITVKEWWF